MSERDVVMEPESILPGQFWPKQRRRAPERELMIAVLRDALRCVAKHRDDGGPSARQLFADARRWLLAGDAHWPYSFERICDALDLDASAVRRACGVEPPRALVPTLPAVPVPRRSREAHGQAGRLRPPARSRR